MLTNLVQGLGPVAQSGRASVTLLNGVGVAFTSGDANSREDTRKELLRSILGEGSRVQIPAGPPPSQFVHPNYFIPIFKQLSFGHIVFCEPAVVVAAAFNHRFLLTIKDSLELCEIRLGLKFL